MSLDKMNENGIKKYFEHYGVRVEVKKETSLCSAKLSSRYVYYLEQGIASLTSLTADGEEKDYIYFPSDRLLGIAPVLMRHYRRKHEQKAMDPGTELLPFGIDTKTDCLFYRMPEELFEQLVETDFQFQSYVMEAMTYHYVTLVRKLYDLQDECAMNLLCKWLLTYSYEEGAIRVVPRGFTYAEIAKYLGVHQVTVSKIASGLKKEGLIKKENGHIIILNEEKLRERIR